MRSTAISSWLWRLRLTLFAVSVLFTVLAASQVSSLTVSNSLEIWYPQDDPVLRQYHEFEKRFGNDEIVVVALTSDDGFDSESGVQRVSELTDELYYVDGVASVISISTVPTSLSSARDRLISDDGKTVALLAQLEGRDEIEMHRHAILDEIRQAVDKRDLESRLAGYGVIYDTLNQASTEGSATLLIAAHGLMFILLLLFFRRIGSVLATLATVASATIWTMGLYAALDQQINMVTMALPTLVMVIAIADCVHVLRAVARQPRTVTNARRAVTGMAAVFGPCLLTSVTTALGFLALLLSDLPIVRTLGMFGAVGMLAAFVATFSILPFLLATARVEPRAEAQLADSVAARLSKIGTRYPWRTLAAFAALSITAVSGMRSLTTDTYSIGYLSDQHQTRLESDFIEAAIGPYAPIDYVISAEDVLAAEVLDKLQAWQSMTLAHEKVEWSWSILDALGIAPDSPPSSLPASDIDARLARLRILSPTVANSMMNDRFELRVSFGAPMMSARDVQELLRDIDRNADFPSGVKVQAAGYASLYTRIVERIVSAQITGFALALIIIVLLIGIATRSAARCLLAIPANLLPIGATLGLMGWLDVPLDVATATIATVILGLIVDDTVHILRKDQRPAETLAEATERSIRGCGGSLTITSIILACGFLVLGLADIRSVAWFGLLSSFAMLIALLTDLILLPAIMAAWQRLRRQESPGRSPVKIVNI